jgi:hypothetical protein
MLEAVMLCKQFERIVPDTGAGAGKKPKKKRTGRKRSMR